MTLSATVEQEPKSKDAKNNREDGGLEGQNGDNEADRADSLKQASNARETGRLLNACFRRLDDR